MKASITRIAYMIAFLAVVGYAVATLRGPRGVHALFVKQAEIQELENRNATLAREIERKREHIQRLSDNPAEQELEIRERLKLVNPTDRVYITGDPAKK
jgi:cell division protein FtsB